MGNKVRMLWDFRGPNAQQTAEHHLIHLKEYLKIEEVWFAKTGIETVSDHYSIVFAVLSESDMQKVRSDLKPHRGQVYKE